MTTTSRSIKRAFRHNPVHERPLSGRPDLPATIQTSLFNVGMRVRKAVSDGYRNNHKPMRIECSMAPCPIDPALNGTCEVVSTATCWSDLEMAKDQEGQQRGLCGKRSLPSFPAGEPTLSLSLDFEAMPIPRTRRLYQPFGGARKRFYEDEQDNSSLNLADAHLHSQQLTESSSERPLRAIAQPKNRKLDEGIMRKSLQGPDETMDIDNFEEASFLRVEDCLELE